MSRSFRKNLIFGITTAESEKEFKQQEHQRKRKRVNDALQSDPEREVLPHEKEFGNPWAGPKDGKRHIDSWPASKEFKEKAKRK